MSLPTEWTPLQGYDGVEYINGFQTGDPVHTVRLRHGQKSKVIRALRWMFASRAERDLIVAELDDCAAGGLAKQ